MLGQHTARRFVPDDVLTVDSRPVMHFRHATSPDRHAGVYTFADHLMLGNVHLNMVEIEPAHKHADALLDLAKNHIEEANHYWLKARVFSAISDHQDLDRMREFFERAAEVSRSKALQTSIGTTLQIYQNWMFAELNIGSCDIARQALARIAEDLKLDVVFEQTRIDVRSAIAAAITNSKRTCGLSADQLDEAE